MLDLISWCKPGVVGKKLKLAQCVPPEGQV